MVEYDSLLVIAGDLSAGSFANLFTYDGTNFADIPGKPLLSAGSYVVTDMIEFQGELFVAGSFEMTVDSVITSRVARWDGTTWSPVLGRSAPGQPLIEGLQGTFFPIAYALAVYNGRLIIGGTDITLAGDLPVSNLVSWDPVTELWEDIGGAVGTVHTLATYGGDLYAGGDLDSLGGVGVSNVGRWNGSAWSTMETGADDLVLTMHTYGSDLVIGGSFISAGGEQTPYIAWWDGVEFTGRNAPCGKGLDDTPLAFTEFQNELIAVGSFRHAGDLKVNYIGAYDGTSWSALGTGANGIVENAAADATRLVVVGDFNEIGGVPVNYVGMWNGSTWSALADGAPGNENGLHYGVCFHNGEPVIAGDAYYDGIGWSAYVRRWNGTSWEDLVTPPSDLTTYRIASFGGNLFAGYDYYDGATWTPVPCGWSEGNVNFVEVFGGNIYIGSGNLQQYCGSPFSNALVYDGASSTHLTPTSFATPGSVNHARALLEFDGLMIIAGQPNYDGGGIWYYDGVATQWEIFADDVNSAVYDAIVYDGDLYIGGHFDEVGTYDTGGTPSSKFGCVSNVVSSVESEVPRGVALSQNVPNPFNPTTSIAFVAPGGNSPVSLVVYDVRGRTVRTLVSGAVVAGPHTAVWDGTNDAGEFVASGVYFYRLRAGGETLVRKMVLSK
jgi:hypothetical protein